MTPTSRVAQEVEITGTMKFKGELLFEGKFSGEAIEGDSLVIGPSAEIRAANVRVKNFNSAGLVVGNVEVSEKSQLKSTSHIEGNLSTFRLAMDDGASFSGGLTITKPPTNAATAPAAV